MIYKNTKARRTLVIGYNGGVGRAFLALLSKTDSGKRIQKSIDHLFLLDRVKAECQPELQRYSILEPQAIESAEDLERLIKKHKLTEVIDLSSIDTVDCTRICDELNVNFMCTSVEEWAEKDSIPTDQAIARLLPPYQDQLAQSHLVGSGANPGIVNALVDRAINEFAKRVSAEPNTKDLHLRSILITEKDTTAEKNKTYDDRVFPMTWSPEHCLEELFEPRSFFAKSGRIFDLNHTPTQKTYFARCGSEIIQGMAVPHEETKTLARKYNDVEIAFLYQIPLAARKALASQPESREVSDWIPYRLLPPMASDISGYDRLGVLLTSRKFGELWLGFETHVSRGLSYGSNATQIQVAAGVLAGWQQLGTEKGIHFVENLDTEQFLTTAEEALGPCFAVYDEQAEPMHLQERAISHHNAYSERSVEHARTVNF